MKRGDFIVITFKKHIAAMFKDDPAFKPDIPYLFYLLSDLKTFNNLVSVYCVTLNKKAMIHPAYFKVTNFITKIEIL